MTLDDYRKQNWFNNTIEQLKRHEGFVSELYKDPTKKKNVYSTGYGFNTSEPFIQKTLRRYGWDGKNIDQDQANKAIYDVAYSMMPMIYKQIPNFDKLPDNAKGVVLNMAYQLGGTKFPKFEKMIKALRRNDLKTAEYEMFDSNWGRDDLLRKRTMELRHQMYPAAHPNYRGPNYSYSSVAQTNNITPSNPIRMDGNKKYYTIQSGDTLGKLSKKYNVNLNKIYKLNPGINPRKLRPGQEVRLAQQPINNPNLNQPVNPYINSYNQQPNNIHLASVKTDWLKIANELKHKLATIKKEIPVDHISDIEIKPTTVTKDKVPIIVKKLFNRVVKDTNELKKESKDNSLEAILDKIYNEDKKYWPNGLNINLYNGDEDKLELIRDKDNNAVGFKGLQIRNDNGDKKTAYYSIGILPEYRGHGYASKALKTLLADSLDKGYNHLYTVHKDNKPSLALYNNLATDYPELGLKIFN